MIKIKGLNITKGELSVCKLQGEAKQYLGLSGS
jgi:hypothetical protein